MCNRNYGTCNTDELEAYGGQCGEKLDQDIAISAGDIYKIEIGQGGPGGSGIVGGTGGNTILTHVYSPENILRDPIILLGGDGEFHMGQGASGPSTCDGTFVDGTAQEVFTSTYAYGGQAGFGNGGNAMQGSTGQEGQGYGSGGGAACGATGGAGTNGIVKLMAVMLLG